MRKIYRNLRWEAGNLWLRNHPKIKVVGIAGSVGKTTTKEILATLLQEKFALVKSKANFDPEYNLPLTALKIRNHDFFIAELGINNLGQMQKYLNFARPKWGILTRLSVEHTEFFGSLEAVISEELEFLKYFSEDDLILVNGDDEAIRKNLALAKAKVISLGFGKQNEIRIQNFVQQISEEGRVISKFEILKDGKSQEVETNLLGRHNALYVVMGMVMAEKFGLTDEEIRKGLTKIKAVERRLNVKKWAKGLLLDDSYNSSPVAAKAAIDILVEFDSQKATAVFGNMLELGKLAEKEHFEVGKYAGEKRVLNLFAYGENAGDMIQGFVQGSGMGEAKVFQEKAEMVKEIEKKAAGAILVKGSLGMGMDEVVEKIERWKDI